MSLHRNDHHIYFPGLNALRFFAAICVVMGHIEQFKEMLGLTTGAPDTWFILGQLAMDRSDAVILFFVISGFLITYLLLAEQERTGTVSISKFYLRRMLRIWPVYYLVVLIAFLVIPAIVTITDFTGYYEPIQQDFADKLLLFLFFLPNLALIRGYFPVGATHLWTIGIEEQFYLIWPLLLKRFHKTVVPCLAGVILLKIVVLLGIMLLFAIFQQNEGLHQVLRFLLNFQIEAMAIGGLAAYAVFSKKKRILSLIFHPVIEKLILALMLMHVLFLPRAPQYATLFEQELVNYAVYILYALFILNVACNPNSTLRLENRVFDYLGRLSYGIYAYHLAVIYLTLMALDLWNIPFNNTFSDNLTIYAIVTGFTMLAAAASYQWYERVFLRLKTRFTVIRSNAARVVPHRNSESLQTSK